MMEIALIILAAGVVIALLIYTRYLAAKRRQAIEAWGKSKGLRFRVSKDRGMDSRFRNFSCLSKGSKPQ